MPTPETDRARAAILALGGTATAAKLAHLNHRTAARWLSGAGEPSPGSLRLLEALAEWRKLPAFGARLREAREFAGLDQHQAAQRAAPLMSVREWEAIEQGTADPLPPWAEQLLIDRLA